MDGAPPSTSALHRAWAGLLLLALYRPGSPLVAVHRLAGRALLVTVGLSLVPLLASRPRPAAATGAAGLLAAAAAALASGPLVAWRELAVWAVAVEAGRSFTGYVWLLGDDVRFVLVNRTELEPSTVVALLTLHLFTGMVTGLAALTVVARRANGVRGRMGSPQPPGGV